MVKNAPTLISQNQFKKFLTKITPSLQYKILIKLYNKILMECTLFKDNLEDIELMLERIELKFYPPEFTIMR